MVKVFDTESQSTSCKDYNNLNKALSFCFGHHPIHGMITADLKQTANSAMEYVMLIKHYSLHQ